MYFDGNKTQSLSTCVAKSRAFGKFADASLSGRFHAIQIPHFSSTLIPEIFLTPENRSLFHEIGQLFVEQLLNALIDKAIELMREKSAH